MTATFFIGPDNMGGPMAADPVKAGHVLRGFDPVPDALDRATGRGVRPASSLRETAEGADAVVNTTPSGALVLEVWRELARLLEPDPVIADRSTIDVERFRAAHATVPHCLTVDAPVSGGKSGAEAGMLSFMLGGEEPAAEAGLPPPFSICER